MAAHIRMLTQLRDAARRTSRHIVLSEGADPRVVEGAARAAKEGVARITLLGNEAEIRRIAGDLPQALSVIDPAGFDGLPEYAEAYLRIRKECASLEQARNAVSEPLNLAAMMVRMGYADGTVSGAVATTADVVRAALRLIGPARPGGLVSSFFLMVLARSHHSRKGAFIFADCGLVVDPDARQLADIAMASAQSYRAMTGDAPKAALISFSTRGSASHPFLDKISAALRLVHAEAPDLVIDGELQFDAAFVEAVGQTKAPDSPVKGSANVFIFPNLEAGNIGYKIAERIGGATAIGPVLQGLARPANDLSRGCTADDVYHMIAVTCVQAAALPLTSAGSEATRQSAGK